MLPPESTERNSQNVQEFSALERELLRRGIRVISAGLTGLGSVKGEPAFGFGVDPDDFAFEAADFLKQTPLVGNVLNLITFPDPDDVSEVVLDDSEVITMVIDVGRKQERIASAHDALSSSL